MEKELTAAVTTQEPMLADRLIVVQQLPVIKEQLHSIKAQAQASVAEALALVCTEETLKAVKDRRAALTRDRKDLDARRMVVKNQIMQPFEDFDKVYKECVTDVYGPADEALKGKITDVEAGLKADKEKKVVAYFDELVKANGVEWVSYEDIGIAVTMTASLKSLKSKVKEYVDRVVADVNCINGMENAPEVMAEYKQCRNLAVAINSVSQRKDRVAREEAERKQRLEAQLRAQEAESAVLDAVEEELAAPQVMGTEPPVMDEQEAEETQQESKEQIMTAKFAFMGRTFQCHGTLTQLRELKSFVNEKIDEIQKHEKRPNRGGAPKGNVNAVGNHGGAPPGNQNALKHGGWSAVMFGAFSEENQKAIQDCTKDVDAEDLLIQELQLLTAREAFLLQRITAAQEKKQHIQSVHTSKSSRSFTRLDEDKEKEAHDKEVYIERIDAKVQKEERLPGTSVETSTTTESSYLIVERLERLLTDVQRQKSKVIQQLADLRRLSNSGKNELVDDWVAAVEAADAEVEGEDDGAETT